MIGPDIRRLHAGITVLAVGNGVPRQTLHPRHLAHAAARVLDKVESGTQLTNQVQHVLVDGIAELGILADRFQHARFGILPSMVAYRRHAEC